LGDKTFWWYKKNAWPRSNAITHGWSRSNLVIHGHSQDQIGFTSCLSSNNLNFFRTVVMNCENLKPSSSSILKLEVMGMFVNKMKYPPNMVFSPFFWLNLASWFFLFLSKWLKEFGCFLKKSPIAYTLFLFVKHHQIFSIGF